MTIQGFVWTDHALLRLTERGLTTFEVEAAIRDGHSGRLANPGSADWLVSARTASGIEGPPTPRGREHRQDRLGLAIVNRTRVAMS